MSADTITDDLIFTGRITVKQRADDFMAYFDGDTRRWESGATATEAIGKLVISHGTGVGATIVSVPAKSLHNGVRFYLPVAGWLTVEQAASQWRGGVEYVRVTATDGSVVTLKIDKTVAVTEDSL